MNSLKNITEADVIKQIEAAQERIVLLAPGLSLAVAEALALAWPRLKGDAISVIIDTDPEICRLGYGTIKGLKTAQAAAQSQNQLIAQQPGIRLCVLISDQNTLIFSPTPQLIEGGSTEPDHPNGIVLQAPPESLAADLGAGPDKAATRSIGLKTIQEDKVTEIEKDLEDNPPQKFHISRAQRVFNAKLEFVEFELEGCYISQHTVQIPADLVGLAQKDPETKSKFRSTFRLIEKSDIIDSKGKISEESLRKERTRITQKFLIPLSGHGVVMLRSNKESFQEELKGLENMVAAFQTALKSKLSKIYEDNAKRLTKALLPSVAKSPPENWTSFLGAKPKRSEIKETLHQTLLNSFGDPEGLIKAMKVSAKFKGVTYESLSDADFKEKAAKALPNLKLHEEYDAAPGQQTELL